MLEIKNLNAYYDDFHVLKDVSMTIEKGEINVMLGPNGHGKSTFLKSICGLVDKTKGRMLYNGHNIAGLVRRNSSIWESPILLKIESFFLK